ncbi:hypothetical protein ACVGW6_12550, partial [Enterobacter intestinihominis]
ASGRLFIPGELKIFHGGTPVLAPPRGAATTIKGLVNKNNLNKKKKTIGDCDQTTNHKQIKKK